MRQSAAGEPGPDFFRHRIGARLLVAGVLVIAAGLRLYGIADKDIWIDEANAVIIASQSLSGLVDRLALDSSPPLYYVLLHYWMALFGASEASVRALSAVFGTLIVAVVYRFGFRLFNARVGLYAAALVAIAPIQVLYSQEARMYTLLPLLAIGSILAACRCVERESAVHAALLTVVTAAAMYTHNYALFLLPVHALVALASGSFKRRPWLWLATGASICLLYLPWAPIFLRQLHNTGQYAWLEPYWERLSGARMLLETANAFAFGGGGFAHIGRGVPHAFVAITAVSGTLIAFATLRVAPSREHGPNVRRLLAYTALPLLLALGVSCASTPCYVPGRCDQLVFPAYGILVAVGIDSLRGRLSRLLAWTSIGGTSAFALVALFALNTKEGDHDLAETVLRTASPDEPVICTSLTRASIDYYARVAERSLNLHSFPRDTADHLGNQDDTKLLRHHEALSADADRVLDAACRTAGARGTFLVVAALKPVNEPLLSRIDARARMGSMKRLGEIGLFRQSLVRTPVRVMRFQCAAQSAN